MQAPVPVSVLLDCRGKLLRHFPGFHTETFEFQRDRDVHTWREVELSTSRLADLLDIQGAEDVFFDFFKKETDTKSILWLSDDAFLCDSWFRGLEMEEQLDYWFCFSYGPVAFEPNDDHSVKVNVVSTAPRDYAVMSEHVDALLRLFAQSKKIKTVRFEDSREEGTPRIEPFPASLEALTDFVREPQTSFRSVGFFLQSLSEAQWRVIFPNCNNKIGLILGGEFCENWHKGVSPLIDAIRINESPTKLEFNGWCDTDPLYNSEPAFTAFVAALEVNTNLTDLLIGLYLMPPGCLALLCNAISKNRGLKKLELWGGNSNSVSETDYEMLWSCLGSHPTLKSIGLVYCHWPMAKSEARDQILVSAMRSNKVLLELDYQNAVQNIAAVDEQVRPILELNRFRPLVQDIKEEKDETVRMRMFVTTLESDRVSHSPAFHYFLLKENQDLLAKSSCLEDVLHQQWYTTADKMFSVEQRMSEAGMVPPSYESYCSRGLKRKSSCN